MRWGLQKGLAQGAVACGLLIIAAASVSLAPWGARVAHRTDTRRLKRVFAVMRVGLALYMALQSQRG